MNNFVNLSYDDLMHIDGGFDLKGFISGVLVTGSFIGLAVTCGIAVVTAPVTAPVALITLGALAALGSVGGAAVGLAYTVKAAYN